MQKTISTFFVTVLVIAGIAALAMTILPIPGGVELRIVQSGSMAPTITTGSVVVIRPAESYQTDDVITYRANTSDGTPVTHRIVSERVQSGEPYYTTQGDANDAEDTHEVAYSSVIGRVLFSIPFLGFIFDFVQQPLGFALIVGLPALWIIFDHINRIIRTVREHRKPNVHQEKETHDDIS